MVEEVATEVVTNLPIDLLSTGIVAGTGIDVSEFRSYLRRDTVLVNLGEVSSEFHEALEAAIEEENDRLDTKELGGSPRTGRTSLRNWPIRPPLPTRTPAATLKRWIFCMLMNNRLSRRLPRPTPPSRISLSTGCHRLVRPSRTR